MASWKGFLKGLGKVASIAGPIAAAPFTGGTSLLGMAGMGAGSAAALGAGLGAVGSVASGMSGGRAAGREAEAKTQLDYDEARQQSERAKLRQLLAADLLGAPSGPVDPRAQKFAGSSGSRTIDPETLATLRSSAQTPGVSPLPQSGKMDSFLNTLGMVGQFGGALGARPPVATMDQFQQRKPFFQPQPPRNPWEVQF